MGMGLVGHTGRETGRKTKAQVIALALASMLMVSVGGVSVSFASSSDEVIVNPREAPDLSEQKIEVEPESSATIIGQGQGQGQDQVQDDDNDNEPRRPYRHFGILEKSG